MASQGRLRPRPAADRAGASTKDIDIEWRAEEGELLDALLDAANHDATERESREEDAATNELFRLGFDACEELLADLDPREAA